MLKFAKNIARRAGLGRIMSDVSYALPVAAFYVRNAFRSPSTDGRQEARIAGRPAVYDTFPYRDDRYIALIGHYGNLPPTDVFACRFHSGVTSEGILVDDSRHSSEGEQVLIVLFPVPDDVRRVGRTTIEISLGDRTIVRDRSISFGVTPKRRYLTVAALMKDEHELLPDWIEYHRVIGVDHFVLYDNRSVHRGRVRQVLRPYISAGIATLIDWDYPYRYGWSTRSWLFCHRGQMHHALYKYGQWTKWLLLIDLDEYVYPVVPDRMSILPLLREYDDRPDVAALQFSMIWFGGHRDGSLRRDQGVIEQFVRRARNVEIGGRQKVVVKPELTELVCNHYVKRMVAGARMIDVPPEEYRINHYFAQSPRRRHKWQPEMCEVEDRGMDRFVAALRASRGRSATS